MLNNSYSNEIIHDELKDVDQIFCLLWDNKISESNSYKESCRENIQLEENYMKILKNI